MHGLAGRHEIATATGGLREPAQVTLGGAAADADDKDAVAGLSGDLDQALDSVDFAIGDQQDIARCAVAEPNGGRQCLLHLGTAKIGLKVFDPALRGALRRRGNCPKRA